MAKLNTVDVSVITVGMNHLQLLKKLFQSIYDTAKPSLTFEVVYVDNCSTDGSVDFIKQNYPEVIVVENKTHKGFAFNNNLGVSKSSGKYLAIINPDIILLNDAIDKLFQFLHRHPEIGILVPKLLNSDLSIQSSVRRFITLKIFAARILHGGNDDANSSTTRRYLMKDFDAAKTQEIDWALGAAMFFCRDWYEYLGGFDEKYFLYVEDVDICLRSWKHRKPVVYFPHSVMIHAHQRSSSSGWNSKKTMHLKSMFRYFIKHNIMFNSGTLRVTDRKLLNSA